MAVDLDELAARAREREPDWNEVREQRVLAALTRRAPAPRRPPLGWIAVGTFGIAAALLVVLWVWPEGAPLTAGSRLELEDGSVCMLEAHARVRAVERGPERMRIEQERGRVVYDVAHQPERTFE